MKGNCSATSNFRASPCGVALHSFRRLAKLARSRGCLRCYCSVRRSQHGAAASTHCANPLQQAQSIPGTNFHEAMQSDAGESSELESWRDHTLLSASILEEDSRPTMEDMSTGVHSIILAGGESKSPLAMYRAVAATPFGGTYRMVDVPISNCMRSGITKMYVLTQYMSASLNNHIATTYGPAMFGSKSKQGWVEILAATQTPTRTQWSAGSAEAVRCHLQSIFDDRGTGIPDDLLVLSGQALYSMDFRDLLALHRKSAADVTIATISVGKECAQSLGVARVNHSTGQVTAFVEKPKREILDQMAHTSLYSTAEKPFEASMGIYVFKREVLEDLLLGKDLFTQGQSPDIHFGRDVIPHALRAGYRVFAHHFAGYWQDVTSLADYYKANLALTSSDSPFTPAHLSSFMRAQPKMLPPSVFSKSEVSSSLVGPGCYIIGSTVKRSVIGQCSSIANGCVIEDSLVFGADFGQQDPRGRPVEEVEQSVLSHLGIRENCVIRGAVIDKNVCIGAGSRITNEAGIVEAYRQDQGYIIQSGIVTVLKNAILPPGTVI